MIKSARPLAAALAFLLALSAPLAPQEAAFPVPGPGPISRRPWPPRSSTIKGRVGVYIKHVESGETVGLRDGERFQLASVFKIPVLMTLHKQIRLGRISLDDRIMFEERMKTYGSGLMGVHEAGARPSRSRTSSS